MEYDRIQYLAHLIDFAMNRPVIQTRYEYVRSLKRYSKSYLVCVLTNISVPTRVAASTTSNPLHTSPIASAVVFPCSSVIQLMIE